MIVCAQVCFPPLTGLEVQGTRVEGRTLVVEVRTSVNLQALTIEEVVSKRRRMLRDMASSLRLEVRDALRRRKAMSEEHIELRAVWTELQVANHLALAHVPEHFNDDDRFCAAVADTLKLKQRIIELSPPLDGVAPSDVACNSLPWVAEMAPPPAIGASTAAAYARLFHKGRKVDAFRYASDQMKKEDHFQRLTSSIVVKDANAAEVAVYRSLQPTDIAAEHFVAQFHHSLPQGGATTLLFLGDMGAAFKRPCVMHVKMGTRTFREQQVYEQRKRPDLAKKLHKLYSSLGMPSELSAAELSEGIPKMRYMQTRDLLSTSGRLGWRIESIHTHTEEHAAGPSQGKAIDESPFSQPGLRTLTTSSQLADALAYYTREAPGVASRFLERLKRLKTVLESSHWFFSHELITTSLLFLYDADPASTAAPNVWMYRFNYADKLPTGRTITHRAEWELGNHEDGYLTGLDSLCDHFGAVAASSTGSDQIHEPPKLPVATRPRPGLHRAPSSVYPS